MRLYTKTQARHEGARERESRGGRAVLPRPRGCAEKSQKSKVGKVGKVAKLKVAGKVEKVDKSCLFFPTKVAKVGEHQSRKSLQCSLKLKVGKVAIFRQSRQSRKVAL